MDIWTVVRTILEKNPSIKAKDLIAEVRKKTGLAKSTINLHLTDFAEHEKLYRKKGKYWLEKPQKTQELSKSSRFNIFDWWEKRAERKDRERLEEGRALVTLGLLGLKLEYRDNAEILKFLEELDRKFGKKE